ncbi:MAG: winged helix-turn-helix domain-containing protein [Promethearchaeota archaeon]
MVHYTQPLMESSLQQRRVVYMNAVRTITPTIARRLAIMRQHLAGPRPPPNDTGILKVFRSLGCIQIDPISVVAPSHFLVLWSRLGPFDPKDLDRLLWKERKLFENWAHCTSIVPTEDYPIFDGLMRTAYTGDSPWAQKICAWVEKNKALRSYILTQIRRHGPLPSNRFKDVAISDWRSTGWTAGRNVNQMLTYLWATGKIMVAKRIGRQKWWDLTDRFLPNWTPKEKLSEAEIARRGIQKSLRALGVARSIHIRNHYIRRCYGDLNNVLNDLESEGYIVCIRIRDEKDGKTWPGSWYVHSNDLPLIDRMDSSWWEPRTTLLSPFDNLICDRGRTEQVFKFNFRLEIYVPKLKRKYGKYAMPILQGDRFIGRVDPEMDRKNEKLKINAIYAEQDVHLAEEEGQMIVNTIEELGEFLDAKEIVYSKHIPAKWKQIFVQ